MTPQAILVGIAAGLAGGLLFAGVVLDSSTAVGLALAAPIPVAIASLGWGTAAGFVAAFTAAGLLYAATGAGLNALSLLLTMMLPTAVAGHLAGLARPVGDAASGQPPALDWYPLPRVFHALVGMSVLACVILGWLVAYDPASVAVDLAAALTASGATAEGLTPEQVLQFARLIADLVPMVQPAMLVVTLVVGLYLGALAARISGRLPRPRDDIPAAGRLPRVAVTLFALGLVAALLPEPVGLVGGVVVGAYFAAFSLVGLAALHRRTRGRAGRGLLLFAAYAAIVLLLFPILAFTVFGIIETGRANRPPVAPPGT